MTQSTRDRKRYSVKGFGLFGAFILHPDPQPIKVELIDISENGAGVKLAQPVSEEQKRMLDHMVRSAKGGKEIPVAFSFSNQKMPIIIRNNWDGDCYGFNVSESGHEKLAALAERGRAFFTSLVQAALRKGAAESGFNEYPILGMEYLPPPIAAFVESRPFMELLMPVLASVISENIPSIRGNIRDAQDMLHLQGVLFRFFKQQGQDLRLIIASGIVFLHQKQPGVPLEELVAPATNHLFEDNRLISFEEQARVRDLFVQELQSRRKSAAKKTPADAAEAPALPAFAAAGSSVFPEKHPLADLIKLRFDTFSRKMFFLQKLVPILSDHYFNKYIPRDHEMIEIGREDGRLVKTILPRWIQNELQELATSKERRMQGVVEDHFKLAILEYMLRRRAQNITHEEIFDLFEGKINPQFNDLREKFLNSIAALIDTEVQVRWGDYLADIDFERSKKRAEKEEELRIARLPPVDLAKEFLWPKVVELGEISPLQREFAKAWVTSEEQLIAISPLGGVVLLAKSSFDEFASMVRKWGRESDKADDFFDKVDVGRLYRRTVEKRDGTVVKDIFGVYVDTLQPAVARDNVLEKVIKNENNCHYYILNKSKSYFSKAFGVNSPAVIAFVDKAMLTIEKTEHFV